MPQSLKQALFCVLALVSLTATLAAAEGLRIVPLVRDDRVLVTFELADGFTDEVRAAIRSGLKTTFTYTVDLRLEVPAWVDRTIATTVVANSVEYRQSHADPHARARGRWQGGQPAAHRQRNDRPAVDDELPASAVVPDVDPRAEPRGTTSASAPPRVRATARSCGHGAAARRDRRSSPSSGSFHPSGAPPEPACRQSLSKHPTTRLILRHLHRHDCVSRRQGRPLHAARVRPVSPRHRIHPRLRTSSPHMGDLDGVGVTPASRRMDVHGRRHAAVGSGDRPLFPHAQGCG